MTIGVARKIVKLTDSKVRALKPQATTVRIFDSVVPGFHVRVTPGGSRECVPNPASVRCGIEKRCRLFTH